jgi:hypothetical protein
MEGSFQYWALPLNIEFGARSKLTDEGQSPNQGAAQIKRAQQRRGIAVAAHQSAKPKPLSWNSRNVYEDESKTFTSGDDSSEDERN